MVFDTFLEAFYSVFDLITIEKWNRILWVALRTDVSPAITVIYLISCIFIGSFFIMNLVLATMIDAFSSSLVEKQREEIGNTFEIIEDTNISDIGNSSLITTSKHHTTLSHVASISKTKKVDQSVASSHRLRARKAAKSVVSFIERIDKKDDKGGDDSSESESEEENSKSGKSGEDE